MNIKNFISTIAEKDKTTVVLQLLEIIRLLFEEIQHLKDEISRLKGHKTKPDIKPSTLENKDKDAASQPQSLEKRPGSDKRSKTKYLEIHEERVISPVTIPAGSKFRGYQDYVVQDIIFKSFNIRYRLEYWSGPGGEHIIGKLPDEVSGSHSGQSLKAYTLYQHYQAHVTQPLILEQLQEIGIDISSGQINRMLIEDKEPFHQEKEDILKVGLEVSSYIHVDDTGARHKGKTGYCTHIGNDYFACFESTESKSRINFLKILRCGKDDYTINSEAVFYMKSHKLPHKELSNLSYKMGQVYETEQEWLDLLNRSEVTKKRHIQIASEAALLGSVIEHGINPEMAIISDDAGQFNVLVHALCWIHAERGINKLVGFNEEQQKALEDKRSAIWDYYADLKKYKVNPSNIEKERLNSQFDDIFANKTCFASLNKTLEHLHKNKRELLLVLERPEIPLHNNLSENDIREYVKRRKVSGSTRSSPGRRCRDTFTSLKKTCRKLGISFWDYLKERLTDHSEDVPYLPELIRIRAS